MKKNILLVLICFLLVGCKAEYKIKIKDNNIYDTIKIYEKSDIVNNATSEETNEIESEIEDWERGYEDYTKELYTEDIYTGYKYKNQYTIEEYNLLSQLSKCYDFLKINNANTININTSNEFLCGTYYNNVEELKIIIETDYKVIKSNSDINEDNKYIWTINKNNYKNKPIKIEILKEIDNKKNTNKKSENKINSILIIIIFILLIILLVKFTKKKNRI